MHLSTLVYFDSAVGLICGILFISLIAYYNQIIKDCIMNNDKKKNALCLSCRSWKLQFTNWLVLSQWINYETSCDDHFTQFNIGISFCFQIHRKFLLSMLLYAWLATIGSIKTDFSISGLFRAHLILLVGSLLCSKPFECVRITN